MFFLLILLSLIIFVVYDYISYLRYISFSENIYDLGVNSSIAFNVLRGETLLGEIRSGDVAFNKLIYIPIGLVYSIYPKEYFLMFIQNFFLAFSSIPVYFIGKLVLNNNKYAFLSAFLALLYYPLGGVYWFDFHYMAFLPFFFLSGVYFFLSKNYRFSLLFFFIASITDLYSPVIISAYLISELIMSKSGFREKLDKKETFYLSIIFLISIIVFLLPSLTTHYFLPDNYVGVKSNILYNGIASSFYYKIEFLFRISFSLAFIPFLGFEYVLTLVSYVLFIFFNANIPYQSQLFFQYPSLYYPAVVLMLISGFKRLQHPAFKRIVKKISLTAIAVTLITFILLTPAGVLAIPGKDSTGSYFITGSPYGYNENQKITYTKVDQNLWSMISLIPKGSSVLVQGNFPEFFQGYDYICPGTDYNITVPQYIITDPYSYLFYNSVTCVNGVQTPIKSVNYLLNHFNYGIVYDYEGAELYELNYSLPPVSVHYYNRNITGSNILFYGNSGQSILYLDFNAGYFIPIGTFNICVYNSTSLIYSGNYSFNSYVTDLKINMNFKSVYTLVIRQKSLSPLS
ncbi:DUF2079 domain-containing protein [Caldiplasma sukawensis]